MVMLILLMGFVVFVSGFNNSIIIQWLKHTKSSSTTVNLPISFTEKYSPVGGGGNSGGSWPYTIATSLSSVTFGSRGTTGHTNPSYCICVGF